MKTAIYIDNGITQVVFTAESEFERQALAAISENGCCRVQVLSGSFYACQGGWMRNNLHYVGHESHPDDDSLILVLDKAEVKT